MKLIHQGPAVQSIINITKPLVKDSLSLIVLIKLTAVIFFAEMYEDRAEAPNISSAKK